MESPTYKRIEPCGACLRDPSFGIIHVGCGSCVYVKNEPGMPQKRLVRRVEDGKTVYVEAE